MLTKNLTQRHMIKYNVNLKVSLDNFHELVKKHIPNCPYTPF